MDLNKMTKMYTELQKESEKLEKEMAEIEATIDYHEYQSHVLQSQMDELNQLLESTYNQMENIQDIMENGEYDVY